MCSWVFMNMARCYPLQKRHAASKPRPAGAGTLWQLGLWQRGHLPLGSSTPLGLGLGVGLGCGTPQVAQAPLRGRAGTPGSDKPRVRVRGRFTLDEGTPECLVRQNAWHSWGSL